MRGEAARRLRHAETKNRLLVAERHERFRRARCASTSCDQGHDRETRLSRGRCDWLSALTSWKGCGGNKQGKWNRKTRRTRKGMPVKTGLTSCPNESSAAP